MRVLLVTGHYTPGPGGAETVVALTERLLRDAGHEVVPFATAEPGTLATPWAAWFPPPAGAAARTEPGRRLAGAYSRPARRALESLLAVARPDVAHVHHVHEFLTLSVLSALRRHRVPVVMTLHDYKAVCPNYRLFTGGRPCERCLRGGRLTNALRHGCLAGEGSAWRAAAAGVEAGLGRLCGWWRPVRLFLAPSAFLRDRMAEGGLPEDRLVVLPNPVLPLGRPAAAPTRPARFLYCGRLVPEKGLDVLLTAARGLPPGVTVDVYGSGRAEGALRRRVAGEALPVRLRGFAGPGALAAAYDGATAALLPALWYENCPMSVLEAAVAGVPVVASRIGGLPELVDDGRTGLLVPPGDADALAAAMLRLAADPVRARELGAAARREVARRHDPARHLAALLGLYAEAVSGTPRGTARPAGRRGRRR
ncbi:glycosyltransferase [Microbispora sp. ZYX-F-249]|uniref:Glycosyltransferase n=1 Tax=Microbispora maris TaxID=3144104 RepID=A0ABV0AJI0_9ACTN